MPVDRVTRLGLDAPRIRFRNPTSAAITVGLAVSVFATEALGQSTPTEAPPSETPSPAEDGALTGATMPRLKEYAAPIYPADALRDGVEAVVVLLLSIDQTGKVTDATVEEGAGEAFDAAALQAAPGLLFEPARTADGTPSAARIRFRYLFEVTAAQQQANAEPDAAPAGAFEGRATIASTDAALAGATVTLSNAKTTLKATTDASGGFKFEDLPPGKYNVTISATGYETLRSEEQVRDNEVLSIRYRVRLPPTVGEGLEVVVEGEAQPREVTRRTLKQEEIQFMPGTRGDALKSLQSLPGVARPPGVSGDLVVRGSAPNDTLIFVDGTEIPLVYHFGGLSSVIPTEVLERLDFYPSNFSARYGRASGGIVDVGLRSPSDEYHGIGQIDLIDGRLLLEGPVPGLKDWRFLAAGRRSWVDAWIGPVLEEAGAAVTQAPVYYDYQFILETGKKNSKFRLSFIGSDDALEIFNDEPPEGQPGLAGTLGLHTGFQRLQMLFEDRGLTKDDRLRWNISLGHDDIDFALGQFFFNLNVYSFTNRIEYVHQFDETVTAYLGTDIQGGIAEIGAQVPNFNGQDNDIPFSTEPPLALDVTNTFVRPAAYAEMAITTLPRLRLMPAVRFDYAKDTDAVDVSPRLNARVAIRENFPRTTAKAGVGLYYQPPQFQESIEPLGTAGLSSNRSVHMTVGLNQQITEQVEVSADAYYKALDNLVVGNAGEGYTNDGSGYVVGGEFLVRYQPDDLFFGWVAYSISRSVRRDGPELDEFLAEFDQTHNLTVLGSVNLGSGWKVGARFRLASGSLITPNVCDPAEPSCDPTRINGLYYGPSGTYVALPAAADNSERLPLFHQLDVRVDKKWQFKSWAFSAYLDLQNAYNNPATESVSYNYNYTDRTFVEGLPILPSIGLRGEF